MGPTAKFDIIGLRVYCPILKKAITVPRSDFAIGPIRGPRRRYLVRCRCQGIHSLETRSVSKPTKTRPAQPLKKREREVGR